MSNFIIVFGSICAISLLIQLVYWYLIFNRIVQKDILEHQNGNDTSATIVICAKNEISNLKAHLTSMTTQEFQQYKVLVVDDHSSDGTADYLDRLQQKDRYLIYHKNNQFRDGKKHALAQAIVKLETSWALMTDADCSPASPHWLGHMINHALDLKKTIILGYSPYNYGNSMVSKWSHFEAWITAVQYLSYCLIGRPYMGVGRNVLYFTSILSPELFLKHEDLRSGDDDLTITEIAHADNTGICIHPDSFVYTNSENSWSDYFRQKTRHFSTGHRYAMSTKIMLSLFSLSQMLFFFSLVLLGFCDEWILAISFLLLRPLVLYPVVRNLIIKLDAKFSFFMFILFDFLLAVYYFIFSFAVIFPKKNTW